MISFHSLRFPALAVCTALASVGCDGGGGDTGDGGAGGTATLTLVSNAKPVDKTWFIPLNAANNKLALFSEQREPFQLGNKTGKAVTIKAITLTPAAGNAAEEWSLQKYDIKILPIDAVGHKIENGKGYDFYVRFYPVLGADRAATLKIETDAGNVEVALAGRGAPDSEWAAGTTVDSELAFGTPNKDELAGTLVADASGAQYASANVDFSTNEGVLVGKIGADGKLAWSKFWNGPNKDRARDPGQNAESGGSMGSLSLDADGNLYAIASIAMNASNNTFNAGMAKIKPDGTLAWQNKFGYGDITKATQSAEFYAVDASGSLVYAVGTCGEPVTVIGGEGLGLMVALDPKDGSIKARTGVDFSPTYNDRLYAVRGDGKGNVYAGGIGSAGALLVKFKTADSKPEVEWAKNVGLGKGGNINGLDVDADGNVYAAFDLRGAFTALALGKFGPDGKLLWSKQFLSGGGDKNNVHFVKLFGGKVWLGGRIFVNGFDGQMGDGLVARLAGDGALEWSAFHFSGKGPDEIAEHRVKGIAVQGDKVRVLSQVYTGNMNGVRYNGYWYKGQATLDKLDATVDDIAAPKAYALDKAAVDDAGKIMQWKDPPLPVPLVPSKDKKDGAPPDSDLMVSTLTVK
ncbi:MAG: PQQ-like beta-propeller repeat protein [Deltaproteobacteria bacterium]|nr:PQQ-like beta-propeller repeat protein [Deltaproteobacteria bacterium]